MKSILITGCSSGIGLSAATILAKRGYQVFASARKTEAVEFLKEQGLTGIQLDVDDSASIQSGLDQVLSQTGGTLDALFNNAGFVQAGAIEDLTRSAIREQFETNVFGAMELTRHVLPVMRKQGHGRIVQCSSILGVITMPYYGAYNASKFALEAFSNTLRQELRGTNILISVINPGPITTKIRDNAFIHYQATLAKSKSASYQNIYNKMEENYFKNARTQKLALQPEAVVSKLILALESKHPKRNYYVGVPAMSLAFLKNILPGRAFDWVIAKIK